MGFARFAIQHSYTIYPLASVGLEDSIRVIATIPRPLFSYIVKSKSSSDPIPSTPIQIHTNPFHRLYFVLSKEISTESLSEKDDAIVKSIASKVRDDVEVAIREGIHEMNHDRGRYLTGRLQQWCARKVAKLISILGILGV